MRSEKGGAKTGENETESEQKPEKSEQNSHRFASFFIWNRVRPPSSFWLRTLSSPRLPPPASAAILSLNACAAFMISP